MENLQGYQIEHMQATTITPILGMQWGLIAGFAGTVAMDLTMAGGLSASGLPLDTCYRTIGSTVASFFNLFGVHLVGELTLGVATYHLTGPLLGALYGLILSHIPALQRATLKKHLLYAVLYAEIVSQLILTLVPILLSMPANEALLWYAGSSMLHGVWGLVIGLAAYTLLRSGNRELHDTYSGGTGDILWKTK